MQQIVEDMVEDIVEDMVADMKFLNIVLAVRKTSLLEFPLSPR